MEQKKNQLPSSSSRSMSENHRKQEPDRPGVTTEEESSPSNGGSGKIQSVISEPLEHPVFSTKRKPAGMVPDFFTILPPLRDPLQTETSIAQDATVQECLPFLSGESATFRYNQHGIPHLDRERHVKFLCKTLRKLPASYVAADASRPWMFYWVLAGLSTMGEDISGYRERLVSTVRPIQNITGGFGGGNGQMSHLASTYAILLSLAMVGGKEALDVIDRKAMWKWLGVLKQPDGGFQLSVGGEEDVRGAYCAVVIITLLNLPLDLPRQSPAWSREGDTLLTGLPEWVARCQTFEGGISAQPDAEAHGGYAFCALGCLSIWTSIASSLGYQRVNMLQKVVLPVAQTNSLMVATVIGVSDAYHTCYVLAGLSSAQHKWHFNSPAINAESSGILTSPYQWTVEPFIGETQIYDEEDRVGVLHPVFVIPEGVAEETRAYFASKGGF
ncbi:hypothetical protein B7494_g3645 [Chlorociboria aeruginascens]|nr:hypothetical protein B7494_g3645 [Chlorociboria aeruginascens]